MPETRAKARKKEYSGADKQHYSRCVCAAAPVSQYSGNGADFFLGEFYAYITQIDCQTKNSLRSLTTIMSGEEQAK